MAPDAKEVDGLIRVIRACFRKLKALGDKLHEDIGVTAAMRAVMEYLSENGPETVPQIARAKTVSRQHIQQLVDMLVAAGLAELLNNPAHKRSPQISLTPQGQAVFEDMRRREKVVLAELAGALNAQDAKAARETLAALLAAVENRLEIEEETDESPT